MNAFLCTGSVSESKRFSLWQDAINSIFFPLECKQVSNRPFFGEIETMQVGDLSFSRLRNSVHKCERTALQVNRYVEEFILIVLQIKGTGFVAQDGRTAELGPGDFLLEDSTRPFSFVLKGDCDFENIVVRAPRKTIAAMIGPPEEMTIRPVRSSTPLGKLVFDYLIHVPDLADSVGPDILRSISDISLGLVTSALVNSFLDTADFTRTKSGRIALFYRAKAMIEQHLHDPELTSEKVAAHLRISLRYLQELFHQENTTVNGWIWRRRLERCHRSLAEPCLAGMSVSEIAFSCGFSNFSHFSNRFKNTYSTPPSEFRAEQLRRRRKDN
jgi:AraC family transcriptional activator of tynA and feaB